MMQELSLSEIEGVDGGSAAGVAVTVAAVTLGAAAGVLLAPALGTAVAVGAIAGAASAGIHAIVVWNAVN